MMADARLASLLDRTALFVEAIGLHVERLTPAEGARPLLAFQAGVLSLEHGGAALELCQTGFLPSAITLMRPQFECLVRGAWLVHAASETWVEKLSAPLNIQSAKRADEAPMLAEMLRHLEAAPDSPTALVAQLKEYRDVTWKAMNSYNHGGMHPLSRVLTGYPEQLIYDALRNANAVMALATQLVSIATGDRDNMSPVRKLHAEYADCLPILGRKA